MTKKIFKLVYIFMMISVFTGCSTTINKSLVKNELTYPKTWNEGTDLTSVENNWIKSINIPNIVELIEYAIKNNYKLKQLAYDVKIQRQQIIETKSHLLPFVDVSLQQKTQKNSKSGDTTNSSSVELGIGYEVDIWGKLSDIEQKANLDLMTALALYEQSKQELAANVAITWLNIVEAQQLLTLYQKRITNIRENKKIIEFGYKSGLNSANDVYLIRNELFSEISKLENQKNVHKQSIRSLELHLGKYPQGIMSITGDIPNLTTKIKMGLPEELINRKPSLVASWNQLLSKNATLAFTHKQRLPGLNLSSTIGYSPEKLNGVFSGTPIVWSLLGQITAPIFYAGRLKANEEIAFLELKKAENNYLDNVYTAYVNVENAITNENSLKKQYQATQYAEQNAKYSKDILLNQYFGGLINYTDVLEVQNRLYDLQSRVIQLKKQLLINRIELHLFLGGDFSSKQKTKKENL